MFEKRIIGTATNSGTKVIDAAFRANGYKDGNAICQWFDGNVLKDGTFSYESLKRLEITHIFSG